MAMPTSKSYPSAFGPQFGKRFSSPFYFRGFFHLFLTRTVPHGPGRTRMDHLIIDIDICAPLWTILFH